VGKTKVIKSIDRAEALQKSLEKRLVSLIFLIFMLHACTVVEEGGGHTPPFGKK